MISRNPTNSETHEKIYKLLRYVWESSSGTDRVRRLAKVTRKRIEELPLAERPPLLRTLNSYIRAIPENVNVQDTFILSRIKDLVPNVANATSDLEFITQLLELRKLVRRANSAITNQGSNRGNLVRALGDYAHVLTDANNHPLYSIENNYNMSGELNPDLLYFSNSNNNNYDASPTLPLQPRRLFNNSNNNNNHNYATWANRQAREIMNNKSKKFAKEVKWGVKANKNNAKEWYNSNTGKLKNVAANNVFVNDIEGDVFKPGQLKNLYFDANAKGSVARHLYTSGTIKKSQGKNPYTQQPVKPRKLTSNMINAVRGSMKRRGVNSVKNARKILGKNATKAAIKKKAMQLYMNN